MCPLGEKMAKIWLKLQENGEKKSLMAKVMAKEKYILARTLVIHTYRLSHRGIARVRCFRLFLSVYTPFDKPELSAFCTVMSIQHNHCC